MLIYLILFWKEQNETPHQSTSVPVLLKRGPRQIPVQRLVQDAREVTACELSRFQQFLPIQARPTLPIAGQAQLISAQTNPRPLSRSPDARSFSENAVPAAEPNTAAVEPVRPQTLQQDTDDRVASEPELDEVAANNLTDLSLEERRQLLIEFLSRPCVRNIVAAAEPQIVNRLFHQLTAGHLGRGSPGTTSVRRINRITSVDESSSAPVTRDQAAAHSVSRRSFVTNLNLMIRSNWESYRQRNAIVNGNAINGLNHVVVESGDSDVLGDVEANAADDNAVDVSAGESRWLNTFKWWNYYKVIIILEVGMKLLLRFG